MMLEIRLKNSRSQSLQLAVAAIVLCSSVQGLIEQMPQCEDGRDSRYLLSSGSFHTCTSAGRQVLETDNEGMTLRELKCFGWQEFGQSLPPRDRPLGKKVNGVACGSRHSCALDQNSSVVCWGSNTYGQLDVSRFISGGPVCKYCSKGEYIDDPRLKNTYQKCEDVLASPSEYSLNEPICKHECILEDRAGVLAGFILENNGAKERTVPVYRSDGRFVCSAASVAAGGQHTCVLYGDFSCTNCNTGYVKCFGSNEFGQLEVPECPNNETAEIQGSGIICTNGSRPHVWANISAGLFHTCGITTNQEVVCFGDNRMKQCEAPKAERFVYVSAGAYHSCGITVDGEVRCWGNSSYGQAASHFDLLEQGIIEAGRFTQLSCGASHTCGVFIPSGNTIYGQPGTVYESQ